MQVSDWLAVRLSTVEGFPPLSERKDLLPLVVKILTYRFPPSSGFKVEHSTQDFLKETDTIPVIFCFLIALLDRRTLKRSSTLFCFYTTYTVSKTHFAKIVWKLLLVLDDVSKAALQTKVHWEVRQPSWNLHKHAEVSQNSEFWQREVGQKSIERLTARLMSLDERSTTFLFMAHSSSDSMMAFWTHKKNTDVFKLMLILWKFDRRSVCVCYLKENRCHVSELFGQGHTLVHHVKMSLQVHMSLKKHTV